MENNVTFITNICQHAYNRTDIKTCKLECVCENLKTDLDCGDLIFQIYCNKRANHDYSVAVYATYGLVFMIAIGTLVWHTRSGFFVETFSKIKDRLTRKVESPTFMAKLFTCSPEKDATGEQIALMQQIALTNTVVLNLMKDSESRVKFQFWIKIISNI